MRNRPLRNLLLGALLPVALTALGGAGCVGSIGDGEGDPGTVEAFTYRQLLRSTSVLGSGAAINGGPSMDTTEVADLQVNLPAAIARVSTCHLGELDVLHVLVTQGGDKTPVVLTLETDEGHLLASRSVNVAELLQKAHGAEPGAVKIFDQPLAVRVPAALAGRSQFYVNLFLCVDTTQDGSCADETVSPLGDLPDAIAALASKTRVAAFRSFKAQVNGSTLDLQPSDRAASDATQPEQVMKQTLKNFNPKNHGLAGTPLSLALAARTVNVECQPKVKVRTDGCFVAGTRIDLGDGKVLPVEYATPGMELATFDGPRRRAVRVEAGPELESVIAIQTAEGHRLTVTRAHPMFTAAGLKRASELTLRDRLLAAHGGYAAISRLTHERYEGLVFNFALAGETPRDGQTQRPHQIVANGLVVGDLVLQQRLSQERSAKAAR